MASVGSMLFKRKLCLFYVVFACCRKWGEETFNHLKHVAHSTEGGANGVHFVSGYLMSRNENSPKVKLNTKTVI